MATALATFTLRDGGYMGDYANVSVPRTLYRAPLVVSEETAPLPTEPPKTIWGTLAEIINQPAPAPAPIVTTDPLPYRPFLNTPIIEEASNFGVVEPVAPTPIPIPITTTVAPPVVGTGDSLNTDKPKIDSPIVNQVNTSLPTTDPYNMLPTVTNPSVPPEYQTQLNTTAPIINSTSQLGTSSGPFTTTGNGLQSDTAAKPQDHTKTLQLIAAVILVLILADLMR